MFRMTSSRFFLDPIFRPVIRTGPGLKSIYSLHATIGQSRYDKATLRSLRAKRGVGRPPHKERKNQCIPT